MAELVAELGAPKGLFTASFTLLEGCCATSTRRG